MVLRGRRRTGWRRRRAGRRIEGVGATGVWLTTPVWFVSGALTAAPSGKLLAGCGDMLDAFELDETGGASEVCEHAASEAASSRADTALKRDIVLIFLEMKLVKLLEHGQSCRD